MSPRSTTFLLLTLLGFVVAIPGFGSGRWIVDPIITLGAVILGICASLLSVTRDGNSRIGLALAVASFATFAAIAQIIITVWEKDSITIAESIAESICAADSPPDYIHVEALGGFQACKDSPSAFRTVLVSNLPKYGRFDFSLSDGNISFWLTVRGPLDKPLVQVFPEGEQGADD